MNSVPLTDVLPWGDTPPTGGRTILICDSVETDGRFLLHTLASQFQPSSSGGPSSSSTTGVGGASASFAQQQQQQQKRRQILNANSGSSIATSTSNVLWLACGALTETHILAALRKFGCDIQTASASSSINNDNNNFVQVINVMLELTNTLTDDDDKNGTYLKELYKRIKLWIQTQSTSTSESDSQEQQQEDQKEPTKYLIIVDNVSLLTTFFGSRLVHTFLQNLQSFILRQRPTGDGSDDDGSSNGCLAILCSHDVDQEQYLNKTSTDNRNTSVTGGKRAQYISGGGRGIFLDASEVSLLEQNAIFELQSGGGGRNNNPEEKEGGNPTWERILVGMADGIIDVVPLSSGFARDVHGRLIFTERVGGLGWINRSMKATSTTTSDARGRKGIMVSNSHSGGGGSYVNRRIGSKDVNNKMNSSSSSSNREANLSTTVVNYCCVDNTVKAIRLRLGNTG